MNWRIETDGKGIKDAELIVERGEDEKPKAKPTEAIVASAREAASSLASKVGSKDVHVEIHAHETSRGRGFRPAHVSVTVSALDPKREG